MLIAALALLMPAMAMAQLRLVAFDVRVPKAPMAVAAEGKFHLIYELRVTNLGTTGQALTRVEVSAGDGPLASWEGDSLKRISLRMGETDRTADTRVIPPGRQSLLYMHVAAPAGEPPKALTHRFFVTPADSLEGLPRDTLSGYVVAVDPRSPPVLKSPLKDGPWAAFNGPGNRSGHRLTVVPLEGQARVPQRFATDWIKLGPDGRAWKGDSTKNDSWYGYREPLLAVASGTVVAIKDSIIENVPMSPKMAVPITLETVGGNHVIIDLGNGFYAFYAHIIPGSITVKVGDKVKAGQVIGSLGNSGNSTAPHLHFHLGDAPSPLGTEGIPFVVDEYTDFGRTTERISGAWTPGPSSVAKKELPLQNHVVRFKP